jgi:hypothetical protein
MIISPLAQSEVTLARERSAASQVIVARPIRENTSH